MRAVILVSVLACVAIVAAPSIPAPIYWIVRSGQSLSVGSLGFCNHTGDPTCSDGAAYGSLTLFVPSSLYPPADTQFRTLAGHIYQNAPPAIESSATSMCNQFAALTSGRVCGTADYGWPGAGFGSVSSTGSCIDPSNTCYYNNSIGNNGAAANTGVIQAKALALAQGSAFYVPGVYFNQGETEMNGSTTGAAYEALIVQLQSDYQTSINSAISQAGLIPLFIRQKSTWASWSGGTPRSTPTNTSGVDGVPIGQLKACLDHYTDGTIVCIGPEYGTPYKHDTPAAGSHADGVHKDALGYRAEGALEGKVLAQVLLKRQPWRPFHPRAISISGAVITVRFWVPVGALALDTTNVTALADGNMGFEFSDTGGSGVTMPNNAVALATTDSLTITLSGTPSGTFELRYAWTSPAGACPGSCATTGGGNGYLYSGPVTYSGGLGGPRGNVADTETRVAWNGDALTDRALTFRIPSISAVAPYSWAPADPDLSTIPGGYLQGLFPMPGPIAR